MRLIICTAMFLFCLRAFSATQPNFLFILTDDLGVADLGCYGRSDHKTPNLDRLASEGIRFTSAYCSQPICSPSRAGLMTGKYPARLHITTYFPGRPNASSQMLLHPEMRQQLPTHEVTIAEILRDHGYTTAYFGKWHLGGKGHLPTDQGFESYYPGRANTKPGVNEGSKGEFDLTAKAIDFLNQKHSKPFFLFLSHNTPHIVYSARKPTNDTSAFNPEYADVINSMDETVGLVLETLRTTGLATNTIVIFTSDNGGLHIPEGPHKRVTHNGSFRAGKGYVYEGGLRIPLIVRMPGTKPRVVDFPTSNTDWLPTLLELAGIPHPSNLDGQSISQMLKTGQENSERTFYWHFPHYNNQGGKPAGAIRKGKWKLVEHYENGDLELFDLSQDFGEQNNLVQNQKRITADLQRKLSYWRKSSQVQTNSKNPAWDPEDYRNIYNYFDISDFQPIKASPLEWERVIEWRKRMNAILQKND